MTSPDVPSAPPRPSFWQRRVIDPIAQQLTQGLTPEKIALTLAVGSAFALFPILGTTTLLCLLMGILLRLNQPIIQIVNALFTPLHIPVIFLMVRFGNFLFRVPYAHVGIRLMNQMFWEDPKEFFERFGITALHAIAGWGLIAPFWMAAVYLIALPVLREALRRKIEGASLTGIQPPPDHPVP